MSAPGGVWSQGGCLLWGVAARGGVCSGGAPGGVCSGGVSAPGGVCSRGVSALGGGGISQHALRQTTFPPPVDRQTPVKILPWPNFVAACKYIKNCLQKSKTIDALVLSGSSTHCTAKRN